MWVRTTGWQDLTGNVCQSLDDAMVVIRRLRDPTTRQIVYDAETDGLSPWTNHIVGHVVTFGPAPHDSFYVPVRHHSEHKGNIHPHKAILGHPFEVELAAALLDRPDLHLIGHNLMFDLTMLNVHGIRPSGTLEDTQVNAALLNEFARSYSLDSCCTAAGTTPKKGQPLYDYLASLFPGPADKKQMQHFWKLAGNDIQGTDYAMGDGTATWDLQAQQRVLLEAQNLSGIAKLERDVTRVLYRMRLRGVKIDLEYLAKLATVAEDRIKQAQSKLPSGFNVRGPKDMKRLMEQHGHVDWPSTAPSKRFPEGQPSFTEGWLSGHSIGRDVVAVRKWSHLVNSFIQPLQTRHIHSGRVHPVYNQMANDDFGTCTGRLSCSDPNLQQVPKRNREIAKLFRPIFIPDHGMQWWDADLSQCEPRILAHYSGAKVLIDGYMADPVVDAHQAVTNGVLALGIQIDRDEGKRLNQTLITGGGKNKIITMLGPRGAEIYNGYFAALPEIRTLQTNASIKFRQRGYVVSLLGRRARLEDQNFGYLAMNRLLQCGNADVIKKAMVDIDQLFESTGDKCALLNNAHDAVSAQAPPDEEPTMTEALRLLTDFGPGRSVYMRVPMQADYGVGANWGEATFPALKLTVG